jgi:hypothetical protein
MENKTANYIKYAIGEVILVVVGILLALQINTWNEERKSISFEAEILSQISINLTQDKENLLLFMQHAEKGMEATQKIIKSDINKINHDSIKIWLGAIIQFDRFQPLTNAYEVLKSKGIDQIKDKELRFLLGAYYDDKANFVIKGIGDIEWTFLNDWLPILYKHVVEFEFGEYVIVDDVSIFNPPSEIRNLLIMNQGNFKGCIENIQEGLVIIDQILVKINQNNYNK